MGREFLNKFGFNLDVILFQFLVMSYHLHGDMPHGIPFRLYTYVRDAESKDLELGLKLRCEIPSSSQAVNIKLHVPVPKATTR